MPTYIYECSKCEHSFEEFQKVSDKPLKKCPECGKNKLFKVITGGIHGSVVGCNTIGSIGDKNYKRDKNKLQEEEHKKREDNPEPPKSWYQNDKYGNATSKELNKMTPKQRTRYIMEGRK